MKRIAMLAQNEHDAESALSIARQLDREGWGVAEFVSLDGFFQQGAQRAFEDSGVSVRAVAPARPLRAPFYRLPRLGRLAVVLANRRILSGLADRFDALIVGCDGALERVVINAMRAREKPAYLVINGLHFARPEPRARAAVRRLATGLRLNHLFFSELGQGMCRRIFAPGDHSRLELRRLGVATERIEVTGSPRFARLVLPDVDPKTAMLERLGEPKPVRLLYLMGAWEWHGLLEELGREVAQLSRLAEMVHGWPGGFELMVRLHPRSSAAERRRLESIPGIEIRSAERPLRDDLQSADVVLAVASTGLLEAIAMGRLVLIVDLAGVGRDFNLRVFEESGMWVIEDTHALHRALAQLHSSDPGLEQRAGDEVVALWHFVAQSSRDAAGRIVDRVRADLH